MNNKGSIGIDFPMASTIETEGVNFYKQSIFKKNEFNVNIGHYQKKKLLTNWNNLDRF